MNPLGPLNGKNLGTNVSPWVITPDALAAYRTKSEPRNSEVKTSTLLHDSGNEALDIQLSVKISSPEQKDPKTACTSNSAYMYWTLEQCLVQQALAGSGLRTGDSVSYTHLTLPTKRIV